jgi:small subunit ribosomal protein S20
LQKLFLFGTFGVSMANTDQAKKAVRSDKKKRAVNDSYRRAMKEALKSVQKTDKNDRELEAKAYKAIDKAQKAGIIKTNTASRRKAKVVRDLKAKVAK